MATFDRTCPSELRSVTIPTTTPAPRQALVLNCGSSSVKFALLDPSTGRRTLTGLAERVGEPEAGVTIRRGDDAQQVRPDDPSHHGVLAVLLDALTGEEHDSVVGIGHRIVHGADLFATSVRIDDDVMARLRDLVGLAPLHMPANLSGVEAAQAAFPHLPQVAVFDTAFHQTMPPVAYRYAVPQSWYAEHHVRRYGFHGTSHRYVSARAAELLGRPLEELKMITLHLGNGCSAAAIDGGACIDTSMGLTPLEGLVMGTRSGDIDPGALGYVGERLGLDLFGVLDVLNTESGLLGLSGVSNDMRTLEEDGSPEAALAIDVFCYRLAKIVGAYAVALGGLDAVVFTGGIGEHSSRVRDAVVARLEVLGFGREDGPVALVVPTDEERMIGADTLELVS